MLQIFGQVICYLFISVQRAKLLKSVVRLLESIPLATISKVICCSMNAFDMLTALPRKLEVPLTIMTANFSWRPSGSVVQK